MIARVRERTPLARTRSPAALVWAGLAGVATFGYALVTETARLGATLPEPLLETLLLGVPAVGLCAAGLWLSTCALDAEQVWHVGWYALCGALVASATAVLFLAVLADGLVDLSSLFVFFVATGTEGALVGTMLGAAAVTEYLVPGRPGGDDLDEFAATVAHDLRNPLSLATARLDMARAEGDEAHLEAVERAHDRMEALVDDLLVLAKEGAADVDPEPVSLGAVAADAWDGVPTEGATLEVETDARVLADPDHLRRLLENLLCNAVVHAEGDVTVWVGDCNGGFFVADDGPGIDPADRERVFERGYTTAESGTGFGLNIVAAAAAAHGWSVSVAESRAGGARFEVTGVERP